VRNQTISSILGDGQQTGDLNRLAIAVAGRVNQILTSGQIPGPPVQSGVPLFTFSSVQATSAAATISRAPGIMADQLSTVAPGPPSVSNGVPLALAGLATSNSPADNLDGSTYTAFYGSLGGRIGQMSADAQASASRLTGLVAQAHSLRDSLSGVSLDQEAVLVLQFQKGYQAMSQMVAIINQMTDSLMRMLP
jgi:flagellar hook-associated protein 1 FlgK